mmetsp:Transcript_15608/g.20363  ORF Transcript_15608/g.20363 Transcript_15608/m.20363 type:complete len:96 (-) Transcript_15608:89-376(-)
MEVGSEARVVRVPTLTVRFCKFTLEETLKGTTNAEAQITDELNKATVRMTDDNRNDGDDDEEWMFVMLVRCSNSVVEFKMYEAINNSLTFFLFLV